MLHIFHVKLRNHDQSNRLEFKKVDQKLNDFFHKSWEKILLLEV